MGSMVRTPPGRTAGNVSNWILCAGLLVFFGCIRYGVIPESLLAELDQTLSFELLQDRPEDYKGTTIILGGVILEARNFKEGARLEILQLPLDRHNRPTTRLVDSGGRFMVHRSGFLETAVYKRGRYLTIVGELTGTEIQMIDEVEYVYPSLRSKHIHVWPEEPEVSPYPVFPYYPPMFRPYPVAPYYDPWWPYRYNLWSPYGYYPWSPPVIHPFKEDRPPKERRFDLNRKSSPPSSKGSTRGFK